MRKDLTFIPAYSLSPYKLTTYQRIFKDYDELAFKHLPKAEQWAIFLADNPEPGKSKVKKTFHNFKISTNAKRLLRKKIEWLFYLAKKRQISTYSGKTIFNFKVSFLTLTLPAEQKEPTKFITNNYFNQFLTELRQRVDLKNYVWRLEFQKNKNVHYHILTDTYVDYNFAKKVWNRILSKGCYIDNYRKKFENLSLFEYEKTTNSNKKTSFYIIKKRYLAGKKNKWKNPNSIDIKSLKSHRKVTAYISKYFGKNTKAPGEPAHLSHPSCNPLDNEKNSKSVRLWFCSRKLSKLDAIKNFTQDCKHGWVRKIKEVKNVREIVHDYATSFFYSFSDMSKSVYLEASRELNNYALLSGYFDTG